LKLDVLICKQLPTGHARPAVQQAFVYGPPFCEQSGLSGLPPIPTGVSEQTNTNVLKSILAGAIIVSVI